MSKKSKLLVEWEARQRLIQNAPKDFTPPYDPKPEK